MTELDDTAVLTLKNSHSRFVKAHSDYVDVQDALTLAIANRRSAQEERKTAISVLKKIIKQMEREG